MKQFFLRILKLFLLWCLVMGSCVLIVFTIFTYGDIFFPGPKPIPRTGWLSQLLQDPTCQPPCWEGIVPGETNILDAAIILSANPAVINVNEPKEFQQYDMWELSFDFTQGEGEIRANENRIVTRITFRPDYREILTLEEFIDAHGEPSAVSYSFCFEFGCNVDILYLEKGISLSYRVENFPNLNFNKIKPNREIDEIIFSSPGEIAAEPRLYHLIKWKGYGRYPKIFIE